MSHLGLWWLGYGGCIKCQCSVPLHHQTPTRAVFTPAPRGYLAGHSDAKQMGKDIVGAALKQEQELFILLHLGLHLLQQNLFLLQGHLQHLLQLPVANHCHNCTGVQRDSKSVAKAAQLEPPSRSPQLPPLQSKGLQACSMLLAPLLMLSRKHSFCCCHSPSFGCSARTRVGGAPYSANLVGQERGVVVWEQRKGVPVRTSMMHRYPTLPTRLMVWLAGLSRGQQPLVVLGGWRNFSAAFLSSSSLIVSCSACCFS